MALYNANCNFTCVNIRTSGRYSNGFVLKVIEMGKKILNNRLNFPKFSTISENYTSILYYIVADEAFPLKTTKRPCPGHEKLKFILKKQFITINNIYVNSFI